MNIHTWLITIPLQILILILLLYHYNTNTLWAKTLVCGARSWRDIVGVLSDSALSVFCLVLCLEVDQIKKVVLYLVLKWTRSGKLSYALSRSGPGQESCLAPCLEVDQVRKVVLCLVLQWTRSGKLTRSTCLDSNLISIMAPHCALSWSGPGQESCLVPCRKVIQVTKVVLCLVSKWTRSGKLSCALPRSGPGQESCLVPCLEVDQVRKIDPVNLSGKWPWT